MLPAPCQEVGNHQSTDISRLSLPCPGNWLKRWVYWRPLLDLNRHFDQAEFLCYVPQPLSSVHTPLRSRLCAMVLLLDAELMTRVSRRARKTCSPHASTPQAR